MPSDNKRGLISVKTQFGKTIKAGDTYYGYDLTALNLEAFADDQWNQNMFPDIILVRRKPVKTGKKRNWKLRHMKKEKIEEKNFEDGFIEEGKKGGGGGGKKNKKNKNKKHEKDEAKSRCKSRAK